MEAMNTPAMAEHARQKDAAADVLIVGGSESHARTDRKCLRTLIKGRPEVRTSGVEAALFAASRPLQLVVCDDTLEDMSAREFVRLLRLHPRLQDLPVLMVSVDNTREAVLGAMAAGCSGYLLRPYSLASFCRKIKSAIDGKVQRRTTDAAPSEEAFHAELERLSGTQRQQQEENPVESAMQDAVQLLRGKGYKQARERFREVLEMDPDHPTAHHGLGRCWLALGHPEQARESLRAAAENYLRQGRLGRASAVFEELRKRDPDAKDPLSSSVEGLLQRGDVTTAAQLVLGVQKADRLPENFLQNVARACHFTGDPMGTARRLCDALEEQGGAAPAAAMRSKLLHTVPNAVGRRRAVETIAEREEAPLAPMGNLRAILAVARYTFNAYRRNAVPEQV